MADIVLEDMRDYPNVIDLVMKWGQTRSPRGMATLDAGLRTITVLRPDQCSLPVGIGRKLDPRIAAMEAIQLIAGRNDPEMMIRIAPQFAKYANQTVDGAPYFHGGYGDRLGSSMRGVAEKLQADPDTRQAVMNIWHNSQDGMLRSEIKDFPCTVALGFQIVNDALDINILMRSSDAWLGIPYDIFQFSQLQMTLAHVLGKQVGNLNLTTWSLHVYESNFDQIFNTRWVRPDLEDLAFQPQGIASYPAWSRAQFRAQLIMNKNVDFSTVDFDESEQWYVRMLHNDK